MVNSDTGLGEDIHQHSGWLIPLGFALAVAALSALFLVYYLRPVPALFRNSPTAAATPVALVVGGAHLSVPANYIESRAARGGGTVQNLALFALLPDFKGYSPGETARFEDNGPASPLIHIVLRAGTTLDAESRLSRIYQPYMRAGGAPAPFGLDRYEFRAGSGYGGDDLFAGRRDGKLILILCERPAQDLAGPNCQASERTLASSLTLSYRFKRSLLSDWSRIDEGVTALASGFLRR
jgi:hypothetical protein